MMDPAGAQPTLDDLEPAALAEHNIRDGHSDVLEADVSMTMRRVVVSVNRHHPMDRDTLCVGRHKHHALLLVRVLIRRVRLPHDNVQLTPRVSRSGAPPLPPVQHVLVSLPSDAQFDISSIAAGHIRLCHQERRPNLALQQRYQPPLLLRLAAVPSEYFHVARVGRRAVDSLAGHPRSAQLLRHEAILHVSEPRRLTAIHGLGKEHVPETQGTCALLKVFYDRGMRRPARVALADLREQDSVRAVMSCQLMMSSGRRDTGENTDGMHSSSTNLATSSSVFLARSLTRSCTWISGSDVRLQGSYLMAKTDG